MRTKLFVIFLILVSLFLLPKKTFASSKPTPILMYHYIGGNPNPSDKARERLSVSPDKFDEQMGYLSKNGYTPITFDTYYAGVSSLPQKPIILTFDDGYIDFYLNAYPILRKYNFKAVSFLPTGLIGTSYYLNWNQVHEMDTSGLISFQAHSVTHPNLLSLNNESLKHEIADSKKTLEAKLGKPVNTFAYPYGLVNNHVVQEVKKAGFVGAVTTTNGKVSSISYYMTRIRVSGAWSLADFTKRL